MFGLFVSGYNIVRWPSRKKMATTGSGLARTRRTIIFSHIYDGAMVSAAQYHAAHQALTGRVKYQNYFRNSF